MHGRALRDATRFPGPGSMNILRASSRWRGVELPTRTRLHARRYNSARTGNKALKGWENTYDAQNSITSNFALRQPSREPLTCSNGPTSSQRRSTFLPISGLVHPGRRNGGGPFLNCASSASHAGSLALVQKRCTTAGSCAALNRAA